MGKLSWTRHLLFTTGRFGSATFPATMGMLRTSQASGLVLSLALLAGHASAQANPSDALLSSTPSNPMEFAAYLMEVSALGEEAQAAGEHARAVTYFEALARAVPDRAVSYRRMCESYSELGKREEAIASCARALASQGAEVQDYVSFVHVVTDSPSTPTEQELDDLDAAIAHLKTQVSDPAIANRLGCEVAVKIEDTARLERCVEALARAAPNDPVTLTFEWSLAVAKGNPDAIDEIIARATQAGIPTEAIAKMKLGAQALRDASHARSGSGERELDWWAGLGWVGAFVLLGFVFLLARGRVPIGSA